MKIKEILVLHHSHFDVGYTHTQPILWELQREFIDGALEMLDQTRDFPEHARPRWTCEVTAQVLKWLRSASPESVDKFRKYAQEKRIGISAMLCHTTPLANAEQ
ncbi:MAG: glycoside hydrolase, partial [Calditrichia bacterium]